MGKPRSPKTLAAATELLQEHARIEGAIGLLEQDRNDRIAEVNAAIDGDVGALTQQAEAIRAALEPWWGKAAAELTKGKRKSVELGGCNVGTKRARDTLEFVNGDEEAALAALQEHRWSKPYIRIREAVDRIATLKALDGGRHAEGLKALGFTVVAGTDTFFVKRAEQGGTIAS